MRPNRTRTLSHGAGNTEPRLEAHDRLQAHGKGRRAARKFKRQVRKEHRGRCAITARRGFLRALSRRAAGDRGSKQDGAGERGGSRRRRRFRGRGRPRLLRVAAYDVFIRAPRGATTDAATAI